ncbi:cell division protein PerM [Kitasatospora sp. NBC_00458]|uniref:cell division protein PerM n=1 Tax=Kitasatospora sp. NBC_00458 TaxID=2903568 RepID=UPI002E180960
MTQLMGRPILEVQGELGARPVLSALLAGVRTALLGLAAVAVPVLGLWVVTPYADDGATGAVRLAGALWLLGHGAPVLRGAAEAPLTVTPLLLGLLATAQLYRAGARSGARSGAEGAAGRARRGGAVAVWAGYCAVAVGVVAQCAGPGEFRARVLPDLLVVAALAGAATAAGARRGVPLRLPAGAWERLVARLPVTVRPVGGAQAVRSAALAAGAGLVGSGAVVLAASAVLAAAGGGGRSAALAGGPAAVAGVLLLSVVVLPNAVLWGTAYALGPGFAMGAGAVAAPTRTVPGPVPDFPLFALLPEPGAGGWRLLVCLLPAVAGVVPGLLVGRAAAGGRPVTAAEAPGAEAGPAARPLPWHPPATVAAVLAAALLTGGGAALLGGLSGGALAGGRMAWLGPEPWTAGPAAAGWVVAVAVPVALLTRFRVLRAAAGGAGGGALTLTARRGVLLLRARAYAVVVRLAGRPGDAE